MDLPINKEKKLKPFQFPEELFPIPKTVLK